MVFDKLCGMAERFLPEIRPWVTKARIFDFPARAHEVLPKVLEEIDFVTEHFFLPFPVIVVEDTASAVVLWDTQAEQRGTRGRRGFLEIADAARSSEEFGRPTALDRLVPRGAVAEAKSRFRPGEYYTVAKGWVDQMTGTPTRWDVQGAVEWVIGATKDAVVVPAYAFAGFAGGVLRAPLINAATAMQEVMYFNAPDRFVLEVALAREPRTAKGRIPRSDARPHYRLETPVAIRTLLGVAHPEHEGTRSSPRAHERRRHYRTLKADRFVHKQGTVLVIPATWIGPTEKTVGGRRYRVCTEL